MGPLVVLDDDPTGTQSVADVPVVLDWSRTANISDISDHDAVYVLTNSRSLEPAAARTVIREAATAIRAVAGPARFVLRGDSTLRGHMFEEYLGLLDATPPSGSPPYVVVPALPSAGRVTVDGIHLIDRGGRREPLDQTEYARDPALGYRSSHLLTWGEERSGGYFRRQAGSGLTLTELREGGPERVAEAIRLMARQGQPGILAPDVETTADLQIIASALASPAVAGVEFVVRSGPALAALMSGHAAQRLCPLEGAVDGLLVVCGSHVPTSSRQLAALERAFPGVLIEADLDRLDSDRPEAEVARLAEGAELSLSTGGLAVLSTPRVLQERHGTLASSRRIASNLARVLQAMTRLPTTIVGKGGITSAVLAREGLQASRAVSLGPVAPGVARWVVDGARGRRSLLVFPGNVGGDDDLATLVTSHQPRAWS